MKESLLSSYSNYGRYIPKPLSYTHESNNESNLYSITLKQNYQHQRPFHICKFDIQGFNKLYLIDNVGTLVQLSVNQHSFSTLKKHSLSSIQVDSNNSYNLIASTKNKQLVKVNFENKKVTKIMNLSTNKLLNFEKDYLRETLLFLDYKVVFLCDLCNPSKIKSLKAIQNQIFTYAVFGPTNRFIILAVKGIEIRFVEIMSLRTVHSIKLPFTINNLKMHVSVHQKKIAIYGDCPIIFFINYSEKQQLGYELIQLPFLAQVKQLKFIFDQSLVFVGNNHVIYGIKTLENNPVRIYKLFNESHIRVTCFDISLDGKTLGVASNRTVFIAKWQNGISNAMGQSREYRQIQIIKDGYKYKPQQSKQQKQQNKIYQYQDESSQQEQDSSIRVQRQSRDISLFIKDFECDYVFQPLKQQVIKLPPEYNQLKQSNLLIQYRIYQIIEQLHIALPQLGTLYKDHQCLLIGLVYSFYKISAHQNQPNDQKCFKVCYTIFEAMINCNKQKIQTYSLVICPQIMSIIAKRFNKDYIDFFISNLRKLFIDYFDRENWINLIQYILSEKKHRRTQTLIFVFIRCLKRIAQQCNGEWDKIIEPDQFTKKITKINDIINDVEGIIMNDKYKNLIGQSPKQYLLNSKKMSKGQNILTYDKSQLDRDIIMEQLLRKQQKIRMALINLRQKKPI